jgi:exodeoxyribonuclease-1
MSKQTTSFYWHDYETWGANPSMDRASQFAGLRTDLDLNPIGEPLVVYARPAQDVLPQPGACMVTGISPQYALAHGVPEADFFRSIHKELAEPGTCALGYNTIRFDDEITRYGLYRNFYDPYEREWKDGNSRWDLIDVVRLTRALRPEGIYWPEREPGITSFRLEELTAANGIEHAGAHDALVDVRATIALAKLLKQKQPRLFDYVFKHHDKKHLATMLNVRVTQPVLHVSSRYPARLGCIAMVLPLAWHPRNRNAVAVYDLRQDPHDLLTLDAEQIRERLYTRTEDLPEGVERIPLKLVHTNRAPVVVPANTLTDSVREQWQMDAGLEQKHLQVLLAERENLQVKLAEVYNDSFDNVPRDPDFALYGGGFLSDDDKQRCAQVRQTEPEDLAKQHFHFDDAKLHEMLFRYRARNWPETLDKGEQAEWQSFCHQRLADAKAGGSIVLADYRKELSRLAVDPELTDAQRELVNQLLDWPNQLPSANLASYDY